MNLIIVAAVFAIIGFVAGVIVGRKNVTRVDKLAQAAEDLKTLSNKL